MESPHIPPHGHFTSAQYASEHGNEALPQPLGSTAWLGAAVHWETPPNTDTGVSVLEGVCTPLFSAVELVQKYTP